MTYLDIARTAVVNREISEERSSQETSGTCEIKVDCEKSEISEKSPGLEPRQPHLTPEGAERLQARIIAAVTVDPAVFNRAEYDALMAAWEDHETALLLHEGLASQCAIGMEIHDAEWNTDDAIRDLPPNRIAR